ncbi:CidA/LrgA family protein [uncultured Methylobacterium sp.]|uniref:CidA/LrgA family protein n=1 Tax=uncultured Methylobacterium sp. TaxID=157278 RepID=UPI0035CC9BDE
MLEAIVRVFGWLAAGEILTRAAGLPIPAPAIGLILLYADLLWHRRLPETLGALADRLLGLLGMLFVPAGVGVIAYADILEAEWLPVAAAVVGGTLVTFLATAVAANLFATRLRRDPQPAAQAEPRTRGTADVST